MSGLPGRRRTLLSLAVLTAILASGAAGCTGGDESADTARGTTTGRTTTTSSSGSSSSGRKSVGALDSGIVARVNDGDTITLRDGRKIRLLQIDAPELFDDCYGQAARREAEKLMPPGTKVTLQKDPALDDRDRFGRYLRYVEANALNLNAALVSFGAAVPYFFRGERGRYARDLLGAVAEARRTRAGLWKACPNAKLNTGLGSITGPS